jgi:hypothetical protein
MKQSGFDLTNKTGSAQLHPCTIGKAKEISLCIKADTVISSSMHDLRVKVDLEGPLS